jgi:hypothetical protein
LLHPKPFFPAHQAEIRPAGPFLSPTTRPTKANGCPAAAVIFRPKTGSSYIPSPTFYAGWSHAKAVSFLILFLFSSAHQGSDHQAHPFIKYIKVQTFSPFILVILSSC